MIIRHSVVIRQFENAPRDVKAVKAVKATGPIVDAIFGPWGKYLLESECILVSDLALR